MSTSHEMPRSWILVTGVVKTRTKGRKGRWPRSHEGIAGAAPTGRDDEQHPATFAFRVGQQSRVAATRSAHTWSVRRASHADLRAVLRTLVLPVSNRAAAVRREGGGWAAGATLAKEET